MKFSFVALAALFAEASASMSVKSAAGTNVMQSARRLNDGNQEIDFGWVKDFDIKYQGCHHIKQWNDEADGQEDVRIYTKRLVRFRLCPSGTCNVSNGGGCDSEFGDYIIDMDTFVESYYQAKREATEAACEYFVNYQCDCEDDDGKGDDFDRDYCEYDCYMDAGKAECVERNPYVDDEQAEEEFNLEEWLECKEVNGENGDDAVQYFVGPYCSEQGGAIKLGVFTDDACTEFSERSFYSIMGYELPYSDESIVGEDCLSCMEDKDWDNQNDQQDEDEVREQCEELYSNAGKCEVYLPEGTAYEPNTQACNYMQGIKIVRSDGLVDVSDARPSAVSTAFIVIFAMAFAAMAFYVWYLRTRLGVKKNALL